MAEGARLAKARAGVGSDEGRAQVIDDETSRAP
jgi:hypothetical protein